MLQPLPATLSRRRIPAALLLLALALSACAGVVGAWAASASAARAHSSAAATSTRNKKRKPSILRSPLLWATVDACNPPLRLNTIGIRGSMPGDGRASEQMYMRFRVQYRDPSSGNFLFVSAADSGFVLVGRANTRSRQAGRNFEFQLSLQPAPYRPTYVLRGWVDFQWRQRHKVVRAAAKATTAPHPTGAAGEPRGYTASSCTLGG